MRRVVGFVICFLGVIQVNVAQSIMRAPPRVETKPNLLDSFIPAGMQIIVHLTELMKYELKPQTSPLTTTTSTLRPTPSHKPGIFAPSKPPGPQAYFANGNSYEEYVKRLQQPSGPSYFERYFFLETPDTNEHNIPGEDLLSGTRDSAPRSFARFSFGSNRNYENSGIPKDAEKYFDRGFVDVVKLVNRIDDNHISHSEDSRVQDFLRNFDDSDFRFELLRQKKVPPTKAYVSLLSLYDLLNKESKRLGLNKYNGYTDAVLRDLHQASLTTSAHQLRTVLNKIVEREDTKKPEVVKKIKQLITDLDEKNSYINEALKVIPPLAFAL